MDALDKVASQMTFGVELAWWRIATNQVGRKRAPTLTAR